MTRNTAAYHFVNAFITLLVLLAVLHWGVGVAVGWFIGEILLAVFYGLKEV